MYKNILVNELYKTIRISLFEAGSFYGVDKESNSKAYDQIREEITKGLTIIDKACDTFANSIIKSKANSEINHNSSIGLTLIFCGKSGSRLYSQEQNKELITNDEKLLSADLNDLKKSFCPDNYLEADRIHQLILSRGLINFTTYMK